MQTTGAWLKTVREFAGVSVAEFASSLGCSPTEWNHIEGLPVVCLPFPLEAAFTNLFGTEALCPPPSEASGAVWLPRVLAAAINTDDADQVALFAHIALQHGPETFVGNCRTPLEAAEEARALAGCPPHCAVDIHALAERVATVVGYRPLQIAGAFVPVGRRSGILINNEHPQFLQRFTLAHELGHLWLQHGARQDVKIGDESGIPDPIEQAANRFAAQLLMPEALVEAESRAIGISNWQRLTRKEIYLLSERLGTSPRATVNQLCFGLRKISWEHRDELLHKVTWWKVKEEVGGHILKEHDPNHVHVLPQEQSGAQVWLEEGHEVQVVLKDNPSSGYAWELDPLPPGLTLVAEEADVTVTQSPPAPGTPILHRFCISVNAPGTYPISLGRRPAWGNRLPVQQWSVLLMAKPRHLGMYPRQRYLSAAGR